MTLSDVEPARGSEPSPLMRALRALARDGIAETYWKCAHGVDDALRDPHKDFDLLVDAGRWGRARAHLVEAGFKRFAVGLGGAPLDGVESWLAPHGDVFDHVHLHRALYSGPPPHYAWRLPWEREALAARVDRGDGVFVLDPAFDAPLLAARAALEPKLQGPDGGPSERTAARLASLTSDAEATALARWTAALLGPSAPSLAHLDADGLSTLRERLAAHRRVEASELARRARAHRAASLLRGARRRVAGEPRRAGLRRADRGLLIAILGADGAGKSTQTARLAEWLGQLLDVELAYLGRGDAVSRAQQRLAEAKWWALETFTARKRPAPEGPRDELGSTAATRGAPRERAHEVARDMQRVALAERKRRDLRRVSRLRDEGVVVLTDRYPHPTEWALDGPAIQATADAPAWRHATAWLERRAFKSMEAVRPDVVVCLEIDPAVALARKPDHRLEDIEAKAAVLARAEFSGSVVHRLDASRPLAEVQRRLREIVWEAL